MNAEHPETHNAVDPKSVGIGSLAAVRSAMSYDTPARNDGTEMADWTLGSLTLSPLSNNAVHRECVCIRRVLLVGVVRGCKYVRASAKLPVSKLCCG